MTQDTTPLEARARELLACPFCGKQPITIPDNSYGSAFVTCPDANECCADVTTWADLNAGETLADAITAWNTRAALGPPPTEVREGVATRETWRHVKRGTLYEVLGDAELQDAAGFGQHEHACLTIYRGEDGKLWARNSAEFQDGRFERIATPPMRDREAIDPALQAEIAELTRKLRHGPMEHLIQAKAADLIGHLAYRLATPPSPCCLGVVEALKALMFEVRCNREPLSRPVHKALMRADAALQGPGGEG